MTIERAMEKEAMSQCTKLINKAKRLRVTTFTIARVGISCSDSSYKSGSNGVIRFLIGDGCTMYIAQSTKIILVHPKCEIIICAISNGYFFAIFDFIYYFLIFFALSMPS